MSVETRPIPEQTRSRWRPGIRLVAGVDAVLLGLLPMVCALLESLGNLRVQLPVPLLIFSIWGSPLVFYIQNGRLNRSFFDFFVGHLVASFLPGLILLVISIWAWFKGGMAGKALIVLAIVAALLDALAVLSIRSFHDPERFSRWAYAAVLIGFHAWYLVSSRIRAPDA